MLHGINNNGDNNILNTQISGQDELNKVVTNPIQGVNPRSAMNKAYLIDESAISKEAFYLYQREIDIQQFTKLAMSNPDDTSHVGMVNNLFANGVIDPFCSDNVNQLVTNKQFLQDLDL